MHGSDSTASAFQEIPFFFNHLLNPMSALLRGRGEQEASVIGGAGAAAVPDAPFKR